MPSAFRHLSNARECKEPSASPFKRVLAGANAWRVSALLQTRSAHRIAAGAAIRPRVPFRTNGRVAQLEEARRRERRQCWFDSSRDYHFEPEALIAKPPPFKRLRWVQVPTGSPPFRRNDTPAAERHRRARFCTSAIRRHGNRLTTDWVRLPSNRSTAVTRAQAQPRRSLRSQPKGDAARFRAVVAAVDRNLSTNNQHTP